MKIDVPKTTCSQCKTTVPLQVIKIDEAGVEFGYPADWMAWPLKSSTTDLKMGVCPICNSSVSFRARFKIPEVNSPVKDFVIEMPMIPLGKPVQTSLSTVPLAAQHVSIGTIPKPPEGPRGSSRITISAPPIRAEKISICQPSATIRPVAAPVLNSSKISARPPVVSPIPIPAYVPTIPPVANVLKKTERPPTVAPIPKLPASSSVTVTPSRQEIIAGPSMSGPVPSPPSPRPEIQPVLNENFPTAPKPAEIPPQKYLPITQE